MFKAGFFRNSTQLLEQCHSSMASPSNRNIGFIFIYLVLFGGGFKIKQINRSIYCMSSVLSLDARPSHSSGGFNTFTLNEILHIM
jgi:hypothetical protein